MQGEISTIPTQRSDWQLACPSPMAGTLLKGYYNAGSGLADDTCNETDEFSRMQVLTDADKTEYVTYLDQLRSAGYKQIMETAMGENQYAEFSKDGLTYHITYLAGSRELRVCEDRAGVMLTDFAYDTVGDQRTEFYQYGLYYDPDNQVTDRTVNCGMMYIFRLSDNSLVIVDSAHLTQSSTEAMEGVMAFLHQITGTQAGEKIRIAAWYATHAHGDHVTLMAKLCNRYHDELELERVMYSFPSYQVRSRGYDGNTTTAKAMIRKYYPNVKFLKLHSGQKFNLSDLGIEVLYTHEDAIGESQFANALQSGEPVKFDFRDYNSCSSVVRFYVDGKTVLMLGDISTEAETVIVKNFTAGILKSDALQAAHHCFNYLNTLYPMIAAPIVLMPNSYDACHRPDNFPRLQSMLKYVENDQIYYEAAGTYGFAVVDGKITLIHESPVIGGEYDFSGI